MKNERKNLYLSAILLAAFALWTAAVCFVDVKPIGPCGSSVGFAAVNRVFHQFTGVHMTLYCITDWLGLVPIFTALGFALLGLAQWVKRKKISRVDPDILILGGFYIAVIAAYVMFEILVVNYRPVLIDGVLEASYPSSTTLLTMCVMPTAMMQLKKRIKNTAVKNRLLWLMAAFTAFMVFARLISGVHWFTDIVGGALLSAGLVKMYRYFADQR